MSDTIFALSSGSPPAAIAIIRISGPWARPALEAMTGRAPDPRRAALRSVHAADGELLDEALVLWMPGPATATGEDCVEIHCHGGRAVVTAVLASLARLPGLREAQPGEFTRRAFVNGRIDLTQAEALGDLLQAETALQRQVAQAGVGGALSSQVEGWRARVLALSAVVEAALDFSDEDDFDGLPDGYQCDLDALRSELDEALALPRAERLRDGIRVVIGGPPNSGKSSLFNALLTDSAAIVSPIAGTTRDVIERPVAFSGIPFVLVDTAGLRQNDTDEIEAIGIARAEVELARADIVLWLGVEGAGPEGSVEVEPQSDREDRPRKNSGALRVSSMNGEGLARLEAEIVERGRALLPKPGDNAIGERQAALLRDALAALAGSSNDPLLIAEQLRVVRTAFDRLLGRSGVEDMLDALFGRFCIGK